MEAHRQRHAVIGKAGGHRYSWPRVSKPPDKVQVDPAALVRAAVTLADAEREAADREPIKRLVEREQDVADYFRRIDELLQRLTLKASPTIDRPERIAPPETADLTPRQREVLDRLLEGDSQKQIATKLGISPHTVAGYLKDLHRIFDVNSRGELLAKFVQR